MKVVILDEIQKRSTAICEKLEARGHSAVACRGTGEFIDAVESESPGKILIEAESWKHGSAIYRYFSFGKRFSGIPVIVYNAPDGFAGIAERDRHDEDQQMPRAVDADTIADGV